MSRPTVAYVDLESIRHNVRALGRHVEGTKMMCMVKADAYGHGLVPVAEACAQAGAYALGVATEPIRQDPYTHCAMTFFQDPDGLPLEIHE